MSALTSVILGVSAAMRLAMGKPEGAVLVSGDRENTVNSFWAIAFCLPSVICRLLMSWLATGIPPHAGHLVARELVVFVLGWLMFVEVTHRLAGPLGRTERWGRFIALWNWCNVIEGVLVVAGGIPGMFGAPAIVDEACQLVMIGWALWLEWYATRLTLGIGATAASCIVVLDQAIAVILGSLAIMLGP